MTIRIPAMAALLCLSGVLSGMVSACATTTAGTATPLAEPPTVTTANLSGLLLPAAEVGDALSGTEMVVTREVATPWDDSRQFANSGLGCLAVSGAAQRAVYADTGFTAVRGQVLRETPTAPSWTHFATQAVVLFNSAKSAENFFNRSRDAWTACSNRDLTYTPGPTAEQRWSIGPAKVDSGVLAVSREQISPQRWSCQRALTVHGHVAVDVEACGQDGPTTAATTIARAIADRIGPA
jgi:hypothetical protein